MAKGKGLGGVVPPSVMQVKSVGPLLGRNVPPVHVFPDCAAPGATIQHDLQKLGSVTPPDTVMHKNRGKT